MTEPTPAVPDSRRAMPLHTKMLIGFVIGIVGGITAKYALDGSALLSGFITYVTQPVGQIFLRLLFMLVIPLLFSALVLGVAELGDIRSLGRVGWKTLAYTIVVSAIAVAIGLVLVNLLEPGVGISPEAREALLVGSKERASAVLGGAVPATGMQLLVQIVPDNIVRAASNGDMLGIMFFALMVGIALVLRVTPGTERLKGAIQGLYDVAMTLIDLVIRLAPYAVACLLFTLTATLGWGIMLQLAKYVGVVVLALAIHQFVVYSIAVRVLGGMSPIVFFRAVEEAMLTAFSTASSSAALPTALRVAEQELHIPPKIARFVLTVGATANQNGTALFEGVTVLFLAQFFGVELSLSQQILVMFVSILGGIGTAGVPAGSIPVVAMILGMVGIPVEGIGLILGVDRFLDMCRTTLNVTGDLAAAVVVSNQSREDAIAAPTPVVAPPA